MNEVIMPAALPVSLPSFIPASHSTHKTDSNTQENCAFVDGGDQIDFDLLAEYLLDEGYAAETSTFDFRCVIFFISSYFLAL